ncbi:MAG: alpha/beta hydrolase [Rhodospirillaceae bacterium]
MRRIALALAALAVFALAAVPRAAAAETIGIVMMHGKDAKPNHIAVASLSRTLAGSGFLVDEPDLPWAEARGYDVDYEQAMAEIDAAVARLKARGATSIVVAGHSLGANAAIGYGARRKGLKAVVALAPGHSIDHPKLRAILADSVAKAKAMVAAGRGEDSESFTDGNHGRSFERHVRARIYLSYFDPEGPAAMARNAAKLSAPLLMVVGERDPLAKLGPDYAFAKAPANPKSRYVSVDADHMGTPAAAGDLVLAWLKGL